MLAFGYQLRADSFALDSLERIQLEDVVVTATRAGNRTPVPHSNISGAEIKGHGTATNLPMLLQTLPSVVAFTEGGTGVGNTSFRIRGTDATRINVTLNGMPLNNPVSSEVFWVNLPNLAGSLQNVQLQRGVGTSTMGGSAFGANLSLQTAGARSNAYGEASTSVGSFNTFQSFIAAGTGVLNSGFSFDVRYSYVTSDGYIRNAFVDHNNLHLTLSHYSDRQLFRLVYLRGRQVTGITWNGVSKEDMERYGRRFNRAGMFFDSAGNRWFYDNETDNYNSDILQLIYTRNVSNYLDISANLSYKYGFGFHESYRRNQRFSSFGFPNQVIVIDDVPVTFDRSDVIRRRLLENHFYVANLAFNYRRNAWNIRGGGMYSLYNGDHFGRLPWVKHNQNITPQCVWYENHGRKQDINVFVNAEYQLNSQWSVFGDVQGRFVNFRMEGMDSDQVTDLTSSHVHNFFNPKAGVFFRPDARHSLYAMAGIGNREPRRADIVEVLQINQDTTRPNREILPERLYNFELGYRFTNRGMRFGVNFYYMHYYNQLVQTGRLNRSGAALLENVENSYRMGIELEASVPITRQFRFDGNATFSRNRIREYTARYAINWSSDYETEVLRNTTISFSPSVISTGTLTYQPLHNLGFRLTGIYVGQQFMDNRSDANARLDAYFVSNFSVSYRFQPQRWGAVELDFFVNNLLNNRYISNGWSVKTLDGAGNAVYTQGFFPQATRNFMTRLTVRF